MAETKGILGTKLGMTQIFDDTRAVPVTVIKAGPCVVSQIKTKETDGYDAVQLAFGTVRPRDLNSPMKGHFEAHDAKPGRYVVEIRTDDASEYRLGQEITVDVFTPGEKVDVVGVSKGHGTSGVIKRHGFHGLKASHGTEKKHRAPGAIGACATPSRVFKDMPMAGQFGNVRVTVLNLEVVQADAERGLLLVRGAVPGANGGLVMARSAVKALTGRAAAGGGA
jgi:large subunit ribosomal protein L3